MTTPKALQGPAAKRYFVDLFAAEPGLPPQVAAKLAERCIREIAQVRVHRPFTVRATSGPSTTQPAPPAFDPFQFSLVAVLKKEGADKLRERLAGIASAEHLLALAQAQHVAVAAAPSALDDLRQAIITGAEQRLADRRAAAD